MPVDAQGRWNPGLFPKQQLVQACAAPSRQNKVCVSGPRWASKTWGCHGCAIQHAWDTDEAEVCLLSFTQAVGVESGVWQHLTETFIPDWIAGDFGMEWVRRPYLSGATKRPCCSIRNKHGSISRFVLESLRTEDEVEQRFKSKEYSMIWLCEGSKWKKRFTFDTLIQCLRKPHLRPEEHLFLCDTNPDLDEGAAHWLYHLFYEFRNDPKVLPELKPLQESLKLIEFTIDDNLSLSTERKAEIMSTFAHDQDLLAAYYYGKWTTASADAIFFQQFRANVHVIGRPEPDPEMMYPQPGCIELHTGWDPGPVNCAACIVEPVVNDQGRPTFKVLDELVKVGEKVDMQAFVDEMLVKMAFWEKEAGGHVYWAHHSDRNVFDVHDVESHKHWAQLIFDMSEGKIELQAFERGPGSLPLGIDLLKMILWSDRLYLNGAKCPKTVEMFKSIKRGKQAGQHIQKGSVHKHPFDALRYVVQELCYSELNRKIINSIRKKSESSLVTVPM